MFDKKLTLDNNNMDAFINSLKANNMNMSLENEVLETYQNYLNAIVEKDYDTLNKVLDDEVVVKMNGKLSGKKEFIDSIETGNIIYKSFEIHDVNIAFLDDCVNLKCITKATADVFGRIGSWRDNIDINFKKIDGSWKLVK